MTKSSLICGTIAVPRLEDVDVDIIAEADGSGGVKWSHRIKSSGHDNGGKIKLPKGVGYKIQFKLEDDSGLNVRFDASAPFFCKDGTADPCPGSLTSRQIMVDSCKNDELVVIDWNYGGELLLRYQLNFVDTVGKRINPYDPIIENGGGGVQPFIDS